MTAPQKLYGVTLKPRAKTPHKLVELPGPACWKPFAEP